MSSAEIYTKLSKIKDGAHESRILFSGHCWRTNTELRISFYYVVQMIGKRLNGRLARTFTDNVVGDTKNRKEEFDIDISRIHH